MDRYLEALEQARNYYPDNLFLDTIFPELAESEDERIRKHIIEILENLSPCHWDGDERPKCIAYLEKQKEQKPAEWSEEDKEMLDFAIRAIGLCRQYAINNQVNGYSKLPDVPKRYEELRNWLNSLRPKPHWKPSEKQMQALRHAYMIMSGQAGTDLANLYYDLKKL